MKALYKFLFLAAWITTYSAITSCNKPDVVTYAKEGGIYMPMAAGNRGTVDLIVADTPQTLSFGAAYGGLQYPAQDIHVQFAVDSSLAATYNAQNGTSYTLLPSFSYTIPGFEAVIKRGTTSSNAIPISVSTKNLDRSLKYILPVGIQSVSSGYIDSMLGTTYFIIDTIQRLEKDITNAATLSVSRENGGGSGAGEGSPKLVDGDYHTKFLTDGFPQDFWVQLTFPSAQVIGAYTITSGNDAPDRDMKDWTLEGSNDGTSWTVLDTQTNETFDDRNQTKRYEFANTTSYTQYRINVQANNGSSLIQISEWRLITYP